MKKFFDRIFSFKLLRENLLVKLICLILGIIAWFYVMDYENPMAENTFNNMKVEILGVEQIENQNLIIGDIENAEVNVTVKGTWRKITRLTERDITLTANLTGTTKGTVAVPIEARVTDSTIAVELSEKIMRVELDAVETEKKPVKARLEGTPPSGVEIGELEQKQTEVSVTGPSEILKHIAYVEAVGQIENQTTSFTSFMQLTPRDDKDQEVQGVQVVEPFLEVEVPFIVEKEVPIQLVYAQVFGANYKLVDHSFEPKTTKVRGEKRQIDKLESILSVEYSLASSSPVETKIGLLYPEGITGSVEEVKAKFEVAQIEVRNFNVRVTQVAINNRSDEYDYEFENNELSLQVEVRDSREVLNKVSASDLKLSIDVNNLMPGNWTTPIKIEGFPDGATASVNPAAIPIIVKVKQ